MNGSVGTHNFAKKIWNAARLVMGQTAPVAGGVPPLESLKPASLADRWIVSRAQRLTAEVSRLQDEFQFGEAGRQLFDFFWSEYCDWYVEIAKSQLQDEKQRERTAHILRAALERGLRLRHPFMPVVP